MKTIALAATLVISAGLAFAQADAPKAPPADIPKPSCGEKPAYPGKLAMQSDLRRNSFKREVDKYKECMMGYVESRKAAYKGNFEAANAAIAEYNETMKKIAAEQDAAKSD